MNKEDINFKDFLKSYSFWEIDKIEKKLFKNKEIKKLKLEDKFRALVLISYLNGLKEGFKEGFKITKKK
jgi:hypothetical protein